MKIKIVFVGWIIPLRHVLEFSFTYVLHMLGLSSVHTYIYACFFSFWSLTFRPLSLYLSSLLSSVCTCVLEFIYRNKLNSPTPPHIKKPTIGDEIIQRRLLWQPKNQQQHQQDFQQSRRSTRSIHEIRHGNHIAIG